MSGVLVSMVPPLKVCSCGTRFTANEWGALKVLGYVGAFKANGRQFACELRNCPSCHSTMGIEVELPRGHRFTQKATP